MEKLQAHLILEVLGRPAGNVTTALTGLAEKMKNEKGVKIKGNKIHAPVLVKDSKDLYTSFMEVDVEFDAVENYFGVLFAYMPSNMELIYPEKIDLTNSDLNNIANQISSRLHNYDAVTKKVIFERDILAAKLKEIAPHLFEKKEDIENKDKIVKKTKKKILKKKSKQNLR